MLHDLYNWTIAWAVTSQAKWALFFISIAESSFFPLPPDILLMTMAVAEPKSAFYFALICSVGSVIGGVLGYLIGLFGGRPILHRFFNHTKVDKVEALYNRYDVWAVGIAGFTPVPYKIITIASGVFKIDFKRFVLISLITRSARFFLVASLLYVFGETIQDWITKYFNIISVLFVLIYIGGFMSFKLIKTKTHDHSHEN